MNLNIGLLGFLTFAAYLIIFGFMARAISARYPDSTASKAIAYIY
jgi:hypothetical protein